MALSKTRRTSNGGVKIKRDTYGKNWYQTVGTIQKRDGNKCLDCSSKHKLHTHHIVPLSKGGLTAPSNLITLCEECHHRRHRHKF
jgi:5-methylcytosine-specific restriction endonuclease McrA